MITSLSFNSLFHTFMLIAGFHPLHISVTEIEMDEKDKRLEIMMRVFIDDLETTLRHNLNQGELDLLSLPSQARDEMISRYVKDHFKISLDGKAQKINYLGQEQEEEAFIIYIEIPNVKKWKLIQVHNDIIMDIYSDQSNLVHVTVKEKVKSLRLTKNNPADQLTFDF